MYGLPFLDRWLERQSCAAPGQKGATTVVCDKRAGGSHPQFIQSRPFDRVSHWYVWSPAAQLLIMKITDLLATRQPAFSFEFFPPRDELGLQRLFETVADLRAYQPAYVSVT